MIPRIRILGIAIALVGLGFLVAGGFTFFKAQEGAASLQAFSKAQDVNLSYENGKLGGGSEEALAIMSLLRNDWKYPVVDSDLNPNDPLVNTATEYMYQLATITYHVTHSTVSVTLDKDVDYNGKTYAAGTYEFNVDGRYYSQFDRQNPIEGPARSMAWSPTALGLIGELGVGTATATAIQMGLGLAGLFGAVGFLALLIGFGLLWVSRQPAPARAESTAASTVISPVIAGQAAR
jgi:hypothetical protein